MRNFLDARRLRYFRAVAEHGSISAAARELNVAQPALSYHIAELESLLGLRILERRHNGVRLTEAGEVLLGHADRVVAALDSAETAMLALTRGAAAERRIRIAVIASLAADLTPVIAKRLSEAMPGVALSIREAPTGSSRALVEAGQVDFAIHLGTEGGDAGIPLAQERLYFVERAAPRQFSSPIRLAEALGGPLVLPTSGNPLRSAVEQAARGLRLPVQAALEIDGSASRLGAIVAGLGSSVFGAHAVVGLGSEGGLCVRPIIDPVLHRPICLSARRDVAPDLCTRIRAMLKASIAELPIMPTEALEEAAVAPPLAIAS